MRNENATKKGPGRRPQTISTARRNGKHVGLTKNQLKALPADKAGAKIFRQAANGALTLKS